jgi:hypothetical protein
MAICNIEKANIIGEHIVKHLDAVIKTIPSRKEHIDIVCSFVNKESIKITNRILLENVDKFIIFYKFVQTNNMDTSLLDKMFEIGLIYRFDHDAMFTNEIRKLKKFIKKNITVSVICVNIIPSTLTIYNNDEACCVCLEKKVNTYFECGHSICYKCFAHRGTFDCPFCRHISVIVYVVGVF